MATYRIVPCYGAMTKMRKYRLERKCWYGWATIEYSEDKCYLEQVMRHLEQPPVTYHIGDK